MPPSQVPAHRGSRAEETLPEFHPALSLQRPSRDAFNPGRCTERLPDAALGLVLGPVSGADGLAGKMQGNRQIIQSVGK